MSDGGYADNSGANSAIEALTALRKAAKTTGLAAKIQIVAIVIANEPKTSAADILGPAERSGVSTVGSLIAPVITLDSLRQENTRKAKTAYSVAVKSGNGDVVFDNFDLVATNKTAFPLGWMLASDTRNEMTNQQKSMLSNPESNLCKAIRLARKTDDNATSCKTAK